ncbi:transcription factor [Sulfurisphaera tokodaii]|uniref:Transcription factor E n=2 Tax=Sulfurisphaera tokodaii TaxID=111955 RepID=TFE_SULTO|nr:transcription factor [Sulfurisphaera tokodaii]Q975T8.1 RecName: Full=Transcription factor E; Short=TFE; AltName: Full=TFIIE subunit alpha homolog; AltName: Full=Transcription initiation factor TFIIE [Sulfurisphaera tokodaii str. 7]BAB65311.1 transcription factor E [Sulfurisphaera tokodaii str. 7]HII74990.1 transcription factor [Sulfurisphaera tokodaii]
MSSRAEELILSLAKDLVGEDATELLKFLLRKRIEMTDDDIAKELNVKVNEIRKKLYLLSEQGFITYRKTRDKETGLFIYYWKVNIDQINELLLNRKRLVLEKLKARYEQEKDSLYYYCPQDNIQYNFDEALENEFKCPKCGSPLEYYDSEKTKKFLEYKIKQIENEIERETRHGSNSR